MKITGLAVLFLVLLPFALSIYYYQQMPEKMVVHWNISGQANGYMSKFWGIFLAPFIISGMAVLFMVIPKIDPLKSNVKEFIGYYHGFVILILLFMLSVHYYVILWNLGIFISSMFVFPLGIGILFFYLGILLEKCKRNWFIGIRTPWTLSSDIVWNKTHKIGGKLFKIAAIISLFGLLVPDYAFFLVLIPIISVSIFTVFYSYMEYQKLPKKKRKRSK